MNTESPIFFSLLFLDYIDGIFLSACAMMSISGLYCDNAIANLSSCSMFRILAFLSPERRLLFYFQVYRRKTRRIAMKAHIVAKPTSKLKIEAIVINYLSIVNF